MEEVRNDCFNVARVCRFCLSQSGVMSPIFHNENSSLPTLPSKIMACAQIQLFTNDGLPSILCHRCLYLAEKSFEFKTRCETSDAMLRKYLSLMQAQAPSRIAFKTEVECFNINQESNALQSCNALPIAPGPDGVIKRKRGRPRKQENLIFYSSPNHPGPEPPAVKPVDEIKMVNGIESVVTVVDPRNEILSNSDEEHKRDLSGATVRELPDLETMRSLALARAKAKKYMGVVVKLDENGTKVRRHLCKGCGKTFGHCSDLRKHVLVHTGERPFHCQLCTKTFSRSTNLNKHLKVHSGQKPFSCSDCSKSFATKGDLQRHLVIHSGIKPFSCSVCHQCFSRKDKLTRHIKLHPTYLLESVNQSAWTGHNIGVGYEDEHDGRQEDDDSSEDVANSETTSRLDEADRSDLVESMVINLDPFPMDTNIDGLEAEKESDECAETLRAAAIMGVPDVNAASSNQNKPHKCDLCYKSFTRRRELLRHESVHTGLKPHLCPICSKAFARKDKLARHKKIHEAVNKKWFCHECCIGFARESSFLEHLDTHSYNAGVEESDENHFAADSDESEDDIQDFN